MEEDLNLSLYMSLQVAKSKRLCYCVQALMLLLEEVMLLLQEVPT